jgi:DNA polymerase III epsilon subunit-like protein
LGGVPGETPLYGLELAALDFEATGLAAWRGDRVCEVGLVAGTGDDITTLLTTFVDPGRSIPPIVEEITGIRDADVAGAPTFDTVLPQLTGAMGQRPIVMHNAPFDLAFIKQAREEMGAPMIPNLAIDTLLVARFLNRSRESNALGTLCARLGIDHGRSHRATDDARSAALVYHALVPYLEVRGVRTVGDLVEARLAGSAELFASEPSSVLLDMLTRAIEHEEPVAMSYARAPGERLRDYSICPRELIHDRLLVADLVGEPASSSGEARRTFNLRRIMTLTLGVKTFLSPWFSGDETAIA